ncbi:hypothetical protein [Streptomyces sp. NPDC005538]|uniref:hypothetical protein n=1 Tax=Streptomyces sp. NPDC005538 TaxID=3157043 RepID=UPI0033A2633A
MTPVARRFLTIGVDCGMMRYVQDHGAGGIRRFVMALVEEIADVVFHGRLPPVDILAGLTADLAQAG